jgi:acyl carrier protein
VDTLRTPTARPDARHRRLSFAQEQLWYLDQLAPGEPTYSILMVWRLRGPLRVDLLRRGLDLVVARHASLRVTFGNDEGTPYQLVAPAAEVPLPVIDLSALPRDERERRVEAEIEAQRAEPFDLEAGPLCRFRLLQLAPDTYVFCQGFHHIITDGWSAALINAELSAAYRSLHAGVEPVFADLELDYPEYAAAQRERLQGKALEEELAYWRESLADLPVLDLPADRPRPADGGHRGETLITDLPDDLRGLVKQLAEDHRVSMFMVLAAAFNLVLSRYTGLEDIPTGVPMLGRPDPELEALVGMFVNMVVLRADLSGDPSFSELVERVADGSLDLYDHQEAPFTQVVDAVQPDRDPDRNPLFQVSIQLLDESNSGENLAIPLVAAEFVPLASISSRFDIAVNIIDTGSSLRANVEYSSDLFDAWRMEAMLAHLESVLRAAAADPSLPLSRIPIVNAAEAEQVLEAGRTQPGGPVYVVDRSMNLVPRGVPGELLVGVEPQDLTGSHFEPPEPATEGLAEGYAEDPFRPGGLVRRTGVLARWTRDLRFEQLGGVQDQTAGGDAGLEATEIGVGESGGDEPGTPTEVSVAEIFGEVLALPKVGAHDSFFSAGGNSLKALLVISRIKRRFGVKLSVRTLYGEATVRTVSTEVDERMSGAAA